MILGKNTKILNSHVIYNVFLLFKNDITRGMYIVEVRTYVLRNLVTPLPSYDVPLLL